MVTMRRRIAAKAMSANAPVESRAAVRGSGVAVVGGSVAMVRVWGDGKACDGVREYLAVGCN